MWHLIASLIFNFQKKKKERKEKELLEKSITKKKKKKKTDFILFKSCDPVGAIN
jgi:hypothetical protein